MFLAKQFVVDLFLCAALILDHCYCFLLIFDVFLVFFPIVFVLDLYVFLNVDVKMKKKYIFINSVIECV